MWNMNELVALHYLEGYVYRLRFDDGTEGDVDFSGMLDQGPVFRALRSKELFGQARIKGGTITWPNGADIAPETLYEMVAAVRLRD